jgi:hypothetical protein
MTKWRDAAIWVVALGLIIYEAVIYQGDPRFALLTLYAGMLGLPSFLHLGDREPHKPAGEKEKSL